MPLVLPSESGVETCMIPRRDEMGNHGHSDSSNVKGKGKRLERSM